MSNRKVVITGSTGQVGSAVSELLGKKENIEIFPLSHSDFDISLRDSVRSTIFSIKPDVIINAGAMTNVDACESEADKAFAINALGVRNLVQAASEVDAQLIHLSTDYVFDGEKKSPYSEFDIANPLSVYATSKLAGDNEALSYDKACVLRVAWVFGNPNGDFFSWVLEGVKNGTISSLIGDAVCTPTYSKDIAQVIDQILTHQISGLINVANSGETTRLEMGQIFLDKLNIATKLGSVTTESLNRPAKRPLYSALSTNTLKSTTGIEMRNWQDALEDHMEKFK
jgi:dTDP-4-dehydrorhamnose reductase